MRPRSQWRIIALLLAALVTACGGGATSSGLGGTSGAGTSGAANAFLNGLELACEGPAGVACNDIILNLSDDELLELGNPPPGFLPGAAANTGFFDYRSTQSALIDAVMLTPVTVDPAASIMINEVSLASGETSPAIDLPPGEQIEIEVVITAANGVNELIYRVFVSRLPIDNADLAALSLSAGTLDPAFRADTTEYTSTVEYATSQLRLTATTEEPSASLEINGGDAESGVTSDPIPLVVGDNDIEVVVTALDGLTERTYTVTVLRTGSADLTGLSLIGFTGDVTPEPIEMSLSPQFFPNRPTNVYESRAENHVVEVVITATAEAPGAVIEIDGVPYDSGEDSLPIQIPNIGEEDDDFNVIPITVTHDASGGDDPLQRFYTLNVIHQPPPRFEAEAFLKPFDTIGPGQPSAGTSIALSADGDTVAVGAPGQQSGSGAVYIYVRQSGDWVVDEMLKAANVENNAEFGASVALSADGDILILAVGAPGEPSDLTDLTDPSGVFDPSAIAGLVNDNAPGTGAVYMFSRDAAGDWSPEAYIKAFNAGEGDRFGHSVALSPDDGGTLVVGAPAESSSLGGAYDFQIAVGNHQDNDATESGAAYVYSFDGNDWQPQAFLKPDPIDPLDTRTVDQRFGWDVSLSGDGTLIAVGSPDESSNATGINGTADGDQFSSGAVYLYDHNGSTWQGPIDHIKPEVIRSNHRFGWAVSLSVSGNDLAVGEPGQGSNTSGIWDSSDEEFDDGPFPTVPSASSSGAAYVFSRDVDQNWFQQVFIKPSNTRAGFRFGEDLALSAAGDFLIVGARGENSAATRIDGNQLNTGATGSGAAYTFVRDSGEWTQTAYLKAPNSTDNIRFGASVAVSGAGDLVADGALREPSDATGVETVLPFTMNANAPGRGAGYLFRAVPPEP